MKPTSNKWLLWVAAIIAWSGFSLSLGWAKEPVKVLVLPMQINAEKDLSYLSKGIQDMLMSRLTDEGKVVPLGREVVQQVLQTITPPITQESALAAARQSEADYVTFGSITLFGDSISTDAKFASASSGKVDVSLSQFGKDQGDVIFHINLFASQINEKIFGRKTIAYDTPQGSSATDTRQHPDKMWNGATQSGEYVAETPGAGGQTAFDLWKSRRFNTHIIGLSVGDVDGDKRNDVVFINKHEIYVHRIVQNRLERVAQIEYPRHNSFLGVDVADINRNGVAEIFITNYNRIAHQLDSFVLEWRDGKFRPMVQKAPWYYRITNLGDQGPQLLGQRMGPSKLFRPGVEQLKWEAGNYVPMGFQPFPRPVNIHGVSMGRLDDKPQDYIAWLKENDTLVVLQPNGSVEWESDEPYGGSALFIDFLDSSGTEVEGRTFSANAKVMDGNNIITKRAYLPQRVHIADIDSDGLNEILMVKNKAAGAGRLFNKMRIYKSGHVECLAWTKIGPKPKWRTQNTSGQISDYVIGDLNNDGRPEIVLSVIAKSSTLGLGKDRSYLISWSVKPPADKAAEKKAQTNQ